MIIMQCIYTYRGMLRALELCSETINLHVQQRVLFSQIRNACLQVGDLFLESGANLFGARMRERKK